MRWESFFETETYVPRPDNLGCSATSASKLTTVSRPLASAETAYIMVSLQHKWKGSALGSHFYGHSVNVHQKVTDKAAWSLLIKRFQKETELTFITVSGSLL